MPELPEVHALVTDLGARLTGRVVDRFDVISFAALKTFDPSVSAMAGGTITGVARHGKFLDIVVAPDAASDPVHLVLHLARAGWIRWREGAPKPPTGRPGRGPLAARLVLAGAPAGVDAEDTSPLEPGSGLDITEAGTKKSLAIWLVADPASIPGVAQLGPDPLDDAFTEGEFQRILAGAGRSQIKKLLRNQSVIAGIGNAYSDEILHAARMSPFKPADMDEDDASRLYSAMQSTLRGAIERSDGLAASELKRERHTSMRVHGRTGEACPVCGDTVRQVIYSDSTLQYCPTCQTGGKPLADRVLSRLLK